MIFFPVNSFLAPNALENGKYCERAFSGIKMGMVLKIFLESIQAPTTLILLEPIIFRAASAHVAA